MPGVFFCFLVSGNHVVLYVIITKNMTPNFLAMRFVRSVD